jgi:hypothetical protein
VEKKVLKELAIRELSEVRVPLTFGSVMGERAESRFAASLSNCQVFFRIIARVSKISFIVRSFALPNSSVIDVPVPFIVLHVKGRGIRE